MLSASSKYAIRALLYLAKAGDSYMKVDELSEKIKVPGPYLSKVMKTLAQKKKIDSKRGLSGGVRFLKRTPALSFYDICVVMKDPIVNHTCILSKHDCKPNNPCPMHNNWGKLRARNYKFLESAKIK